MFARVVGLEGEEVRWEVVDCSPREQGFGRTWGDVYDAIAVDEGARSFGVGNATEDRGGFFRGQR